ncbi:hypothetical protein PRZ48_005833 [Zasmidium cellare]|uniref:GST N-terminal domain-containing protein n=1 Tax=Zasmidium cellare TaxID=395010 RepID=A0ABR0EMQ0_ZASCE|nr:hypothetical protein PRZ48_005833 [Zasmidium cellare]
MTTTHAHADTDGHFRRKPSAFRDTISRDPNAKYPAEKGRYLLYMNYGCPWAHRAVLVRKLKGLEGVVEMVATDFDLTKDGWMFNGKNGSAEQDPIFGAKGLKEVYLRVQADYEGRYTVPCLFDKKTQTIVNNESSEIIRMFYEEFDELIPEELRERNKEGAGFFPERLRGEIEGMNEWDIRLYTTAIRFDAAYHTIFQCNLKSIRHDYPNLHLWLRRLYWDDTSLTRGAFKDTTNFFAYRYGYAKARGRMLSKGKGEEEGQEVVVIPAGPKEGIEKLGEGERL